jgi:hypothetical protein
MQVGAWDYERSREFLVSHSYRVLFRDALEKHSESTLNLLYFSRVRS